MRFLGSGAPDRGNRQLAVGPDRLARLRRLVLAAPLLALPAACEMAVGPLAGRASDTWTHTYPLAVGGEVQIVNTNGKVEVEGVEGATVEIRAERIARAATNEGARGLLPRIVIKEEVTPDRVSVQTERMPGIMLGAGFEVHYDVKAPKGATVRATTTNGEIAVRALAGKLIAQTTNGDLSAKDLTGGVDARTTNGDVRIDLASLGPDRVELTTTNGGVTLTLPETAKADLSASCTNGRIDVSAVKVDATGEQTRRRVEGRINGGGTPIQLRTTNGRIRVRPRGTS
jgi:hypothetical protein